MLQITSSKNGIIKEVKGLYKRKDRWKEGLFIIEGIKIIEEAFLNNVELKYIIISDKIKTTVEGSNFYEMIKYNKNLIHTTETIFKDISDTENSQGIIGIAKFHPTDLDELLAIDNPSIIFLDGLQDPGNLGTIIRTCDAFNLDGIILGEGSVDPYNSKVVRSTMGSIFRVPLVISNNSLETLNELKRNGIRVLSTSLEASLPLFNMDFREGFALVIGNESKGVSEEIINISDALIKIPMPGLAESLNAGVAASIIMYEAMKGMLNFLE